MTDENSLPDYDKSEKLLNGRRAEALLRDSLLNAVFAAVADHYINAWQNAPRGDLERQHVAHASLAALKDVVAMIRAHLSDAKLYESDLAMQKLHAEGKPPY